ASYVWPPYLPTSSLDVASTQACRARRATEAPDAANSLAMARPRPLLEPVITATRPSMRTSIVSLRWSGRLSSECSDCRQHTLGGRRRIEPHCGLVVADRLDGVIER